MDNKKRIENLAKRIQKIVDSKSPEVVLKALSLCYMQLGNTLCDRGWCIRGEEAQSLGEHLSLIGDDFSHLDICFSEQEGHVCEVS